MVEAQISRVEMMRLELSPCTEVADQGFADAVGDGEGEADVAQLEGGEAEVFFEHRLCGFEVVPDEVHRHVHEEHDEERLEELSQPHLALLLEWYSFVGDFLEIERTEHI